MSASIVGEKVKRSTFALVLASGLVIVLRKQIASLLKQLNGTVVRTEHRNDDGDVAHERPVSPSL
jgi:hypothetical protein